MVISLSDPFWSRSLPQSLDYRLCLCRRSWQDRAS